MAVERRVFTMKLSDAERAELEPAAKAQKMELGPWMRSVALAAARTMASPPAQRSIAPIPVGTVRNHVQYGSCERTSGGWRGPDGTTRNIGDDGPWWVA